MSKAFDILDHSISIEKLCFFGIIGMAIKVFENYLLNRKQNVIFDRYMSNTLTIRICLPQGSVLVWLVKCVLRPIDYEVI